LVFKKGNRRTDASGEIQKRRNGGFSKEFATPADSETRPGRPQAHNKTWLHLQKIGQSALQAGPSTAQEPLSLKIGDRSLTRLMKGLLAPDLRTSWALQQGLIR
jgi:hypothetical protein